MNIKSALVLVPKIVVLTIVMFFLFSIGSSVFTAQLAGTEMSPEESAMSALGLLVVSLIDTLILTYFILRSRLSGLRLMVVVALVFYGVKTFTSMLEAWYFMPNIAPEELPGLFLFTVPMAVIFPLVAVPILGKAKKQQEADESPNTRLVMPIGQLVGKVTFLSVIVYSVLFWAFGYYIALRNPDVAAFYGVTVPDSFIAQLAGLWATTPLTYVFEFFRGGIMDRPGRASHSHDKRQSLGSRFDRRAAVRAGAERCASGSQPIDALLGGVITLYRNSLVQPHLCRDLDLADAPQP